MFYKNNIWSLLLLTIFTTYLFVSEVCVQEPPSSCARETYPSCVKLSTSLTIISLKPPSTIKSIASLLIELHIKFRIINSLVLISENNHLLAIENAPIFICLLYYIAYKHHFLFRNKFKPFKNSWFFLLMRTELFF